MTTEKAPLAGYSGVSSPMGTHLPFSHLPDFSGTGLGTDFLHLPDKTFGSNGAVLHTVGLLINLYSFYVSFENRVDKLWLIFFGALAWFAVVFLTG